MINESELPILTEDAEEAAIVRSNANKCDKVSYQIEDMNKSVTSQEIRETTVEAMLVDNETNQQTLNPSSEGELSTPERPSGPSLEEPLPMHVETEIEKPSDNHPIIINMCIMSRVESAAIVTANDTLTGGCISKCISKTEVNEPHQSNPTSEERPVALQSDDLNKSINKMFLHNRG